MPGHPPSVACVCWSGCEYNVVTVEVSVLVSGPSGRKCFLPETRPSTGSSSSSSDTPSTSRWQRGSWLGRRSGLQDSNLSTKLEGWNIKIKCTEWWVQRALAGLKQPDSCTSARTAGCSLQDRWGHTPVHACCILRSHAQLKKSIGMFFDCVTVNGRPLMKNKFYIYVWMWCSLCKLPHLQLGLTHSQ